MGALLATAATTTAIFGTAAAPASGASAYKHSVYPRERDGSGPIIPPDRLDFRYLNDFRADMMIWRRVGAQDYFSSNAPATTGYE